MLPWLEKPWQSLSQRLLQSCLPHAILLQGPKGIGKSQLARHLSQAALCPEAEQKPCGVCTSCHWFHAGTHPDWMLLTSDETAQSSQIKINQVRELVAWMNLTAQGVAHRVALIDPADSMNISAANSLLKTLEEPAGRGLLILVTSKQNRLPATLHSRCQRMNIGVPNRTQALAWLRQQRDGDAESALEMARGAPLLAVEMMHPEHSQRRQRIVNGLLELSMRKINTVSGMELWQEEDTGLILCYLAEILRDLIRLRQTPSAPQENRASAGALAEIAQSVVLPDVYTLLDHVQNMQSLYDSNMNKAMMLEELLVRWQAVNRLL